MTTKPNIVYFFVDNFGYGELGCYGGGELRGVETKHIDAFAKQGTQLLNFAPEAQCTPSRSALMTGRHAIRSGTHSVPAFGESGLVAWERTMGDILSKQGYACAIYGKWHIGAEEGRWPTDHGFDEWYGVPISYNEALWTEDPWYDEERDGKSYVVESVKGGTPVEVKQLNRRVKRNLGREYLDRSKAFMTQCKEEKKPFFLYFNHPLMHNPADAGREYRGKSGNGPVADSLMELDCQFKELMKELEYLGLEDNTIVVFLGDNGNDDLPVNRGTSGYWEGSYFTGMEGALRTPCLIRYPGVVCEGRKTNGVVHITDMFTTVLGWAGVKIRFDDRQIDGIDQRSFLEGRDLDIVRVPRVKDSQVKDPQGYRGGNDESNREGFIFWNGKTLYGVKWQNFKMSLFNQKYLKDPQGKMAIPIINNLLLNPKERFPNTVLHEHTWTRQHFMKMLEDFADSVETEPLIPMGAPVGYVPGETEDDIKADPLERVVALGSSIRSQSN